MNDRVLEIKFYYYLQKIFIQYTADETPTILEFIAGMNSSPYCTLDDLQDLWNKLMQEKNPYYVPFKDDAVWLLHKAGVSVRDISAITGACASYQAKQIKFFEEHPDQRPSEEGRFKDIFNEEGKLVVSPHIAMQEFIDVIDKFKNVFRGRYEHKKC